MFKLRSVIVQDFLPLCIARRFNFTVARGPLHVSLSRSNQSRSRPGPPESPLSRLPAACRHLSSLNKNDVQKRMENISDKFKEAMELLDDARGSVGTVYFSEDMTDAEDAIQDVLSDYESLIKDTNEDQRQIVIRTIGLKIEELKAQVQMLKDSLKD